MWQGIDQRRFPRAKYKCTVILRKQGEPSSISSVTENVGLGGVCVFLERSVDIFSPVEIELNLDDGKPPVKSGGTVVWVVRRGEVRRGASFDTGIEFSQLTPEDKARLEAIIEKQAQR